MSNIRSKNTKPEILVRKYLFSQGIRFRVNVKKLPGTPDIVLRKYRTVIFVNGCFWHGHEGCKYYVLPKTNTEFWKEKIERNKERDLKERMQLRNMGWHVILLWECQLKSKVREQNLNGLVLNTVKIAVLCVAGTLTSCSLAAFGFAKFQAKGKNILFMVVLSTMMVPTTVTLIPMYNFYSKLHWLNTITPLVLPAFFGASTYNIFLLRQFFAGLPNELGESAQLDGAGWFRIFRSIYLPNAKPALLVAAINQLVFCWNDYMGPLIYLGKPATFTIALGLNAFKGEQGATMDIGPLMAMACVTILPVLLLYLFFQKYFVEGVAASGIKG